MRRATAEDQTLAVHEAGHAVIACVIGHKLLSVSLADGARTLYRCGDRDAAVREAMIAIAGPAAEQRYRPTTQAERAVLWRGEWRADLEHVRQHVAACGADEAWVVRWARELVRRHWPAILRVAAALQERSELSADELDALIKKGCQQ